MSEACRQEPSCSAKSCPRATPEANFGKVISAFAVAAFLSICPALFFYAKVTENSPIERMLPVVGDFIISMTAVVPIYLYAISRDTANAFRILVRTNYRLAFLAAAPLFGALSSPGIESRAPSYTLLFVALAALAAGISVYALGKERNFEIAPRLCLRDWPAMLLPALTIGSLLAYYAVVSVRRFNVSSIDLAVFNNILFNSSRGDALSCSLCRVGTHLSAHCDPILLFLVPLYVFFPGPEFLVAFQALWVSSSAIPLYLLARKVLPHPLSAPILSIAFLLHPALHGVMMFEFHSLALGIPLVLWLIWSIEFNRRRLYWIFFVLVLLTREDMSLLAVGVGFYLLFKDDSPRRGLLSLGLALGYLTFVKLVLMSEPGIFMNDSSSAAGYAKFYRQMIPNQELGARSFLLTLLTNPVYPLYLVTRPQRLLYLFILLLPFGFLPLLAGARLLLCGFGVIYLFMASDYYFHSPHFQYSSMLLPFLAALSAFGLARLLLVIRRFEAFSARRFELAAAIFVLVAASGTTWKFGALFKNTEFRAGVLPPVHWELAEGWDREFQELQQIVTSLPNDASVAGTQYILPYLSTRRAVYVFNRDDVDYFVAHERTMHEDERNYLKYLESSGRTVRVESSAGFVVLKRKP